MSTTTKRPHAQSAVPHIAPAIASFQSQSIPSNSKPPIIPAMTSQPAKYTHQGIPVGMGSSS